MLPRDRYLPCCLPCCSVGSNPTSPVPDTLDSAWQSQPIGCPPAIRGRAHATSAIRHAQASITRVSLGSLFHPTVCCKFVTSHSHSTPLPRRLPARGQHLKLSSSLCSGPLFLSLASCVLNTRSLTCKHNSASLHSTLSSPVARGLQSHSARQQDKPMKSTPSTPAEIIAQLPVGFERAREAGDVLFFPSTIHKHKEFGVEVCESLSWKVFSTVHAC